MQVRQQFGERVNLYAAAVTTANGAPTLATDGVPMAGANAISPLHCGAQRHMLLIDMGGSGSAPFHLWGYRDEAWYALGDYDGVLNDGLSVTGSPRQRHAYPIRDIGAFERFYLEVGTVSGTVSITAKIAEILEGDG